MTIARRHHNVFLLTNSNSRDRWASTGRWKTKVQQRYELGKKAPVGPYLDVTILRIAFTLGRAQGWDQSRTTNRGLPQHAQSKEE
jgi:hypothetical protein